jgi:HK97 gp10 family phage protein
MVVEARIDGLDDLMRALQELPANLRRQGLRNALAAGARIVRDAARQVAPVLKSKARFRKAGTMRDAISVRTSKQARRSGNVGVFVNVKPAKRAQRGAKSAMDPFYWPWQEFGWTPARGPRRDAKARRLRRQLSKARRGGAGSPSIPGSKFLSRSAAAALPRALEKFQQTLGPQIERMNLRR